MDSSLHYTTRSKMHLPAHAGADALHDAYTNSLVMALSFRYPETAEHTGRVTQMTVAFARYLGVPEKEIGHYRRGALLHDIGKLAVPDHILLKNGSLSAEELRIIQKHPVYGYEMLKNLPGFEQCADIPHLHHERWNGSGYPLGLAGKSIPLCARVFALVDVWDALSFDRPYRKAWPEAQVVLYIQEEAGKLFDPQLAKSFLEFIPKK